MEKIKVAGFTFVRNALIYDYPVKESILSLLPLVDRMIVLVGHSDDETLGLIQSINDSKVEIHTSIWNESLREGGKVLADETNKALALLTNEYQWAIYIQADEVLPETEYDKILDSMKLWAGNSKVEGLLLNYRHFYGSYDFIGDSRRWYPKEIRIIRPGIGIESYKDAQGFRLNGRKVKVKDTHAYIHHYGWVKHPEAQQRKQQNFNKLWHDDKWIDNNVGDAQTFDYSQIDSLEKFNSTHPEVMKERINKMNWQFSFNPERKGPLKYRFLKTVYKLTGIQLGQYKNYKLI